MKIHFLSRKKSHAAERVSSALRQYLPPGCEESEYQEADLIVLHVGGRNRHVTDEALRIAKAGKKYAVIQYALASTRNPNPEDWKTLWDGTQVVWSYYDLGQHIQNFYHAPMGADVNVFHRMAEERKYLVGTLGVPEYYQAECFGEVHLAAYQSGGKVVHVGEMIGSNPIVEYASEITDEELCKVYNGCKYFSCLRRKEGFEIPAVEALLCGIRPILFDTPNFRQWFSDWALFVPETPSAALVKNLRNLFKQELIKLSDDEIQKVAERFNWQKIIEGFWQRCMS